MPWRTKAYKNGEKMINKKLLRVLAVIMLSVMVLGGCGESGREEDKVSNIVSNPEVWTNQNNTDIQNSEETKNDTETQNDIDAQNDIGESFTSEIPTSEDNTNIGAIAGSTASSFQLAVTFGDSGDAFSMHLYDNNETAAVIAEYVGSTGWRLPIYESDDNVNYDVMQYYDIPSRYEIPSNPQQITEAKAGEVYYSDPNRVILFYGDAEISDEYTLIGYFDPTEEFVSAVRENPILEGWANKIIQINQP